MSRPDFSMIDWSDAELDDLFRRVDAKPLDTFINSDAHRAELDVHEIYNDRQWKGFMPKGLLATEATARLSLGFAKKLWATEKGFGGETQYFGGTIATQHAVEEITLDRQVRDLRPGRYVVLGYTDPVFEHLFYDVLKPVDDDLMVFRGYTGQFPDGIRGWTALLLRRYPFAQMGIDDHDLLFGSGAPPAKADLAGAWRVDALYHSNQPAQIARLFFNPEAADQVTVDSATSVAGQGVLLPKFVTEHFQTATFAMLQRELRTVDHQYLVGKWTTDIHGPYAQFLLAGSPGLFHAEKAGGATRFALYYLLTRVTPASGSTL